MEKIAVMGFGVVGSGVVELCDKNSASIRRRAGTDIEVKYILDLRDFPESSYAGMVIHDFETILNDPEISVVAEVMGGMEPAFTYSKRLLSAGKSVVTSNKELVAGKGAELLRLAKENNVNYLFEASVGGGIPIIRPLHMCLAANEISEIAGILNGTTNFILTKMIRESMPFSEALSLAQSLGYAERDPTADVEGADACRKICILASLVYGRHVYPQEVHTEGITRVSLCDVQYAEDWGGVIKLIGRARQLPDGRLFAMVSPAFISHESQLSSVDDVFNGILVRGDATGDVVFYGKGAGKLPTASAVVGDIIDCVKAEGTICSLCWADSAADTVCDWRQAPAVFYLCCRGRKAKAAASALFGELRFLHRAEAPEEECAFITPERTEAQLEEAKKQLEKEGVELCSAIRVLDY
ncbi:MAG: homoserine dehydrogenase [Provencibacterium sp.]|jgi:homoserine dehydrogenase|nr:homoserine dehydrogenase [Provencibacterium sp.]